MRTASARLPPAAAQTAERFSRQRRAWPGASSFTSSPLEGSSGIWPEQNRRSPVLIAWLYAPIAAGAASVSILRRSGIALLLGDRPQITRPVREERLRAPRRRRGRRR